MSHTSHRQEASRATIRFRPLTSDIPNPVRKRVSMNRTGINPAPSHIVLPATPALPARVTLTLIVVLALTVILTQAAQAQTYTVIHSFGGGSHDGANPITGLTIRGATLYGTTPYGGSGNTGTVYQLTHQSSGWTFNLLYGFQTEDDGILPSSRVVPGRIAFCTELAEEVRVMAWFLA